MINVLRESHKLFSVLWLLHFLSCLSFADTIYPDDIAFEGADCVVVGTTNDIHYYPSSKTWAFNKVSVLSITEVIKGDIAIGNHKVHVNGQGLFGKFREGGDYDTAGGNNIWLLKKIKAEGTGDSIRYETCTLRFIHRMNSKSYLSYITSHRKANFIDYINKNIGNSEVVLKSFKWYLGGDLPWPYERSRVGPFFDGVHFPTIDKSMIIKNAHLIDIQSLKELVTKAKFDCVQVLSSIALLKLDKYADFCSFVDSLPHQNEEWIQSFRVMSIIRDKQSDVSTAVNIIKNVNAPELLNDIIDYILLYDRSERGCLVLVELLGRDQYMSYRGSEVPIHLRARSAVSDILKLESVKRLPSNRTVWINAINMFFSNSITDMTKYVSDLSVNLTCSITSTDGDLYAVIENKSWQDVLLCTSVIVEYAIRPNVDVFLRRRCGPSKISDSSFFKLRAFDSVKIKLENITASDVSDSSSCSLFFHISGSDWNKNAWVGVVRANVVIKQ